MMHQMPGDRIGRIEADIAAIAARAGERVPPEIAVGRHDQLEADRQRASRVLRAMWSHPAPGDSEQILRGELERATARREAYLRRLLELLPFPWHIEHAYAARETARYGGADHIVIGRDVRVGRATKRAGDTLARPRRAFRGLHRTEEGRLPSSAADIRVAEKILADRARRG